MKKFGTFNGVFVPSFEAILGAVLFLLIPGLVGKVGMTQMLAIVALANTATLATAFSISDCTTNLQNIGAGGMYAVAKRSLGKAFGGSIGIQLYIAQAASIGFYAIAFASPLQPILAELPIVGDFLAAISTGYADAAASAAAALDGATAAAIEAARMNAVIGFQTMIISSAIALIAFISAIAGADFVSKIQLVIFVILIVAIGLILASPFIWSEAAEPVFMDSFNWDGIGNLGFIAAFVMFFPAVTGIDAGVGMSGSLKDPKRSLGKGTFIAIGVTFVVYSAIVMVFGLVNPEYSISFAQKAEGTLVGADVIFQSNPLIAITVIIGILVASGSSALSYFITAPKTAQTLTQDRLLPKFMRFLGRDFTAKGKEPRWATVLTLVILMVVIWSGGGQVETASMIVGICFLIVYGWINLAAFFERISGNPSFRPTSRGHWAISLYGFSICMAVIGMWNLTVGGAVLAAQIMIFVLLLKYKSNGKVEGVWWGLLFKFVNQGLKALGKIVQGTKNWRPIISIFAFRDTPEETEEALRMGRRITEFKGITMINFLESVKTDEEEEDALPGNASLITLPDDDYASAIIGVSQAAIPGSMQANTILLPLDKRLNLQRIIEQLIKQDKNVLLYKHGRSLNPESKRIDVWWKGEENGNLMALLSYIITQTYETKGIGRTIRLIRLLGPDDDASMAREELNGLMSSARLEGEALILQNEDEGFQQAVRTHSSDASLVLLGMPGERVGNLARMFSLDKMMFSRQLSQFDNLPPILFVKAAGILDLIE